MESMSPWYEPLLKRTRALLEQVESIERDLGTIRFIAPPNFTPEALVEWEKQFKKLVREENDAVGVAGGLARLKRDIRKTLEVLSSPAMITIAQRRTSAIYGQLDSEIDAYDTDVAKILGAASGLIEGFKLSEGGVEFDRPQQVSSVIIGAAMIGEECCAEDERKLRVVIVGASSGLGRALALEYAKKGATLVLAGRRVDLLKSVAYEAAACDPCGKVTVVQTDVREQEQTDALMADAAAALGCVDVLIINSGIMGWACMMQTDPCALADMNEALLATNFMGVVNVMKSALPYIRSKWKNETRVAITSAMAALTMERKTAQQPLQAVFAASKLAIEGFVRSLRLEESFPILLAYPSFICDTEHYDEPMLYPEGFPSDGPKPSLKLTKPITAAQAAFVYRCGIEGCDESIFFDHCSKMYNFYHTVSRDVTHFLQCFISQPLDEDENRMHIPSEFIDAIDEHHYSICQQLSEDGDVRPLHTQVTKCEDLVKSFREYLDSASSDSFSTKAQRLSITHDLVRNC